MVAYKPVAYIKKLDHKQYKKVHCQGLNNCLHDRVHALEYTPKNVHTNLEITLIFEILESYSTEFFCYDLTETS